MLETKTTHTSVRKVGRRRRGSAQRLHPAAEDYFRRARAGDGPAWRWSRAESLVTLGERPDRLDDPATVAVWQLCSAMASDDVAADAVPDGTPAAAMSQAYGLYVENGQRRWQVEAWLLAGLTVEEVAARIGVTAAVVGAYADMFFDVVGRLRAGDWIWAYAVRVGPWAPAEPTEADVWRYVAASGGPAVLDLMVGDYLSLPQPAPDDHHGLAEDIRTLVRFVTTPMSNTKAFQRVMKQTWRILATRISVRDPAEWEVLVGHMDILEIAAGLGRTSARGQGEDEKRPGRSKPATDEPQHTSDRVQPAVRSRKAAGMPRPVTAPPGARLPNWTRSGANAPVTQTAFVDPEGVLGGSNVMPVIDGRPLTSLPDVTCFTLAPSIRARPQAKRVGRRSLEQ